MLFITLITQWPHCFLSADIDQTQHSVPQQMTEMTHALVFLDLKHSVYCLITHPICFLLCLIREHGIWGWVGMSVLRAPLWELDSYTFTEAGKQKQFDSPVPLSRAWAYYLYLCQLCAVSRQLDGNKWKFKRLRAAVPAVCYCFLFKFHQVKNKSWSAAEELLIHRCIF